ncbi:GDSL-type esterase/lipase family protein [Tautonia rosea]|uniref:GDSL-type esterase/lipase family protein n=1 Tax=Tautonia rosea TaxID=2728037 RepID=UPI001473520B|nr:GDSL-type esterase/lipase family protein [Tautonia rosea]
MFRSRSYLFVSIVLVLGTGTASAESPSSSPEASRIIALGDSITKGVRAGVSADEAFIAQIEKELNDAGFSVDGINLGIGGERTDQALARLDELIDLRPRVVTVMYGTNDSYVDEGATVSRLSLEEFTDNLRTIVTRLLLHGIEPVLMTEPRWADDASPDGLGRNPNLQLEPYIRACRQVASETGIPLVDHFAHWTEARANGQNLRDWTTDGLHPNPRGHQELAKLMIPVLERLLEPPPIIPFETELQTVLEHDDGQFLWYHPRATPLPTSDDPNQPNVLITLQQHLHTSDHYSGLSMLTRTDQGRDWTGPISVKELDWVREPEGVDVAVADVTPMLHPPSGKVIAVGAQVRYSAAGQQLEDRPRAHQTAFAVFDPKSRKWTRWQRLEMPADPLFNFARSACAQFVIEENGSVLLPFYIGRSASEPFGVTVARCSFDGETLTYEEHGNILALDVARGLYEPSLIRCDDRYYLTLRNDLKGYVSVSPDGLNFRPAKAWTFDDGTDLGSYNTQQHWLSHQDGLFLVYTRRGANNDHIMRHRAPLFLAQVDPDLLQVIRSTERVIIPERGGELGNFGASTINDHESWVTVSEGVWNEDARRRGATGALFIGRVLWGNPPSDSGSP